MQVSPVIFREYDIRGTVGTELTPDFAYALGRAYADLALSLLNPSGTSGRIRIGVGYDCRLTSAEYAHALTNGLTDGGCDSVRTGMGPTPQLYYAIHALHLDGGIQVTGSHNPPDMNGFKLCLGTESLFGKMIQELRTRIESDIEQQPVAKKGVLLETPIRDRYIMDITSRAKPFFGERRLRVVVDAGNGVGGLVGPRALRSLGVEVLELYCEPDGNFPNHHPDPTVLENIRDLQRAVVEQGADFGIGWDGDADRIGVIDEKGEPIFADLITLLFARDILERQPGATIIGDVKCSSRVFDDIASRGGNPIMWKTGHSLIKHKLKETDAALAGEMSGHIAFGERWYGFDDALYSSVRLAELMSRTAAPLSTILGDLPPAVSTPEIRVDCPEEAKFVIPERLADRFTDYPVDRTDGVRVTFPKGWALVRASNTQSILVLRFEAETEELLQQYQDIVNQELNSVREQFRA